MNELLMTFGGGAHLALIDPDPDPLAWQDDALCRQVDADLFFPDDTGGLAQANVAKRVCALCPVQVECLEYALANDIRWGVWGNASETERRKMRRERHGGSTA